MWNIAFLFAGFFFIALLLFVFISKKRLNFIENKIFLVLTITNFIGYISELSAQFAIRILGKESMLVMALGKIYLVYILVWMGIFSIYAFMVTRRVKADEPTEQGIPEEKLKRYKHMKLVHIIFIIITSLISLMLPMLVFYDKTKDTMYSYGTSVDFLKIILGIYIVLWLVRLACNFKMMREKKTFPIATIIFLLLLNIIIQTIIDPAILIATFTMTFTCYVLWFTIENPDIKIIEELNILKEQNEVADKAKNEFMRRISHELKTPLNYAVVSNSLNLDPVNLKEVKENAIIVENALNNINDIALNSLAMSDIMSGRMTLENKAYKTNDLIIRIRKMIFEEFKLDYKNVEYSSNVDENIPKMLIGDEKNIFRILRELLLNAFKYTNEKTGSVHLDVESEIKDNDCIITIIVKDTGIGMKKDEVNKLFKYFERQNIDKNQMIRGAGLGLSVAKKLIELMNGQISVKSVYGEGTVFTVKIIQEMIAGSEKNGI